MYLYHTFDRFMHTGLITWSIVTAAALSSPSTTLGEPAARWVAGDFHNHSRLTDGSHHPRTVMEKATREFGLDWIANSEHGGAYRRDAEGRYWKDPAIQPPVTIHGTPKFDKDQRQFMWRWQSLCDYSFPILSAARKSTSKFGGKVLLLGIELHCPGHDDVSVGILADTALPLAEFEYRFDAIDTDTSGGPGGNWKDKNNTNDHAKALQAIKWLDDHYRGRSWFIANHPERANKVQIADLRDFNNTAPEVAFGFEGAPGHQKDPKRGGYTERSFNYKDNNVGDSTCGGVGVMVARVGGVWDALLGEGRPFFAYANSDFHDEGRDFFPGEYQKTYVKVAGPLTEQSLLDSLRAGRSFFVAGDLVDAVEFQVSDGSRTAETGQTLQVQRGTTVNVTMRLHDPAGKNHLGDDVSLRGLDLIGGDITGPVSKYLEDGKTPNPAYSVEVNPSTRILAHFDSSNWQMQKDGWIVANFKLDKVDRDMYLRLRGTNMPPSAQGQTDEHSNPLSDASPGQGDLDGVAEARADLWVYANPIFIRVRQ